MYRPVQQQGNASVRTTFFSDKNFNTLQTVLAQDFQERNGAPLNDQQVERLGKTLNHYMTQVYGVQGEKPIQNLNKEVLSASAKDFSQYLQRKELTKGSAPVKTVMDDKLFQETSQRFSNLSQERNEIKALPPPQPDFRIDFREDGPPPAEPLRNGQKATRNGGSPPLPHKMLNSSRLTQAYNPVSPLIPCSETLKRPKIVTLNSPLYNANKLWPFALNSLKIHPLPSCLIDATYSLRQSVLLIL